MLIIGIFSVYFFVFRDRTSANITINNASSYPAFDEKTTEYRIYTSENSLTFSCSGSGKIEGCDGVLPLTSEYTEYSIEISGKTYNYKISKLPKNSSTISIEDIRGVPNAWVGSATLVVDIQNNSDVKYAEFSFNGGKTWQKSNTAEVTKNGIYKIQARDYFGFLSEIKSVKITQIDSETPSLEISKENVSSREAILSAIAIDSGSGIKSYLWNTGATSSSITVKSSGTYSVVVKDEAGNEAKKSLKINFEDNSSEQVPENNDNKSEEPSKAPEPAPIVIKRTFSALFVGNGASTTFSSQSCDTTDVSCNVTTPQIMRDGFEILGWSTYQNAMKAEIAPGQQVSLSGNMTYYAVTQKTVSAKFVVSDENAVENSSNFPKTLSCTIFNQQPSCLVTTPALTAKAGYEVLGWGDKKTDTSAKTEQGKILDISDNATFYAVTKENNPLRANFIILDEKSAEMEGGTTECYRFNGSESCTLVAPELRAKEGYDVVGWQESEKSQAQEKTETEKLNSSENSKEEKSKTEETNQSEIYKPGEFIEYASESEETFYAVTKNSSQNTLTFVIQDTEAVEVEGELKKFCKKEESEEECLIPSFPKVSAREGYEFLGWSLSPNSEEILMEEKPEEKEDSKEDKTQEKVPAEKLNIKSDTILYSVTKRTEEVVATFNIQDSSAGSLSETEGKCQFYNGNNFCKVSFPEFEAKQGYELVGWSTNPGEKSGGTDSANISGNVDFYSITRETSVLSASFNLTDSTISSQKGGEATCHKYNGEKTCKVTAPALSTIEGYSPLGWNTDADAKEASVRSGDMIDISGGERFYSVIVRSIKINFHSGANVETTTCELYGTERSCEVTFPTPSSSAGVEYLGWAKKSNTSVADYSPGMTYTATSDMDFYAISRTAISIIFESQEGDGFNLEGKSATCYLYGDKTSCGITTPLVESSEERIVLGWNTDKSATTASIPVGGKLEVSGSGTYYLITRSKEPVIANFTVVEVDGEKTVSNDSSSESCYLFNSEIDCKLVAPELSGENGFVALGWSEDLSSKNPELSSGASFSLEKSRTFYSIAVKASKVYFEKNNNIKSNSLTSWLENNIMADSISFGEADCVVYNSVYCNVVKAPRVYSTGNRVLGFSPEKTGDPYLIYSSGFKRNSTLYSRVWNFIENDKNFKLGTTHKITTNYPVSGDYYPVEFEAGIEPSVVEAYSSYVDKIFSNIPALKQSYGKMRISNIGTYNSYENYEGSAGTTYSNLGSFAQIDVLSPYTNIVYEDVKHAIVHEIGHSIDAFYLDHTKTRLCDYPEFSEAFEKLKSERETGKGSISVKNLPLSDYAFNSKEEFLAEAFVAYYRDKFNGYARESLGKSTDELNNAFEKYLCYADNDFNMETNCEL